jgi:hypothetical protein
VGGAIVAGTTTDFPITLPNLGVQKVPRSVRVALDFDHPSVEDLTVEVVHPLEDPDNPGNPWIGYLFGAAIPGSAATPPSGSFSGTVTFDDINVDAPPPDPIVLSARSPTPRPATLPSTPTPAPTRPARSSGAAASTWPGGRPSCSSPRRRLLTCWPLPSPLPWGRRPSPSRSTTPLPAGRAAPRSPRRTRAGRRATRSTSSTSRPRR